MVPVALVVGVVSGMREGSRARSDAVGHSRSPRPPRRNMCPASCLTHHFRHLARMAQRLGRVGDRRPLSFYNFTLPVVTVGDLRHGLCRADDARFDDRGDERAIYPHRAAQGSELFRDRAEARVAQRADRAVHGDHAAVSVAAHRRRHRRGDVPLPGVSACAGRCRRQQRHRPPARLLDRVRDAGAHRRSSSPTSATPVSIRASACIREARAVPDPLSDRRCEPSVSCLPVWASLAVVLGVSFAYPPQARALRPRGEERDRASPACCLSASGCSRRSSPHASSCSIRSARSREMKYALPGAIEPDLRPSLSVRRRQAGARRVRPRHRRRPHRAHHRAAGDDARAVGRHLAGASGGLFRSPGRRGPVVPRQSGARLPDHPVVLPPGVAGHPRDADSLHAGRRSSSPFPIVLLQRSVRLRLQNAAAAARRSGSR